MFKFLCVFLLFSVTSITPGLGIPHPNGQAFLPGRLPEQSLVGTGVSLYSYSKLLNPIESGNHRIEEWVEGDIRFVQRGGLLYELAQHPYFSDHQLRITEPQLCDPSVQQYSGYLDVSEGRHLFFWFFEARNSPETAPVILWLNGGPGCTSTTGLLFELGPCSVTDGGMNSTYNPHSWNEHANVIFLDQPAGVGYSYSSDWSSSNTSPAVAKDVYAFFEIFFRRHSKYASLPLHIAAESYGGHYAPNIAYAIHMENLALETNPDPSLIKINLESIMLGNGLTDPYTQFGSTPEYACGGPYPLWKDPNCKECTALRTDARICQRLIKTCSLFNTKVTCAPANLYCWQRVFGPVFEGSGQNPYDARKPCDRSPENDGPYCYRQLGWVEQWMNDPLRKRELGVAPSRKYEACNAQVNMAFRLNGDGVKNSALLVRDLVNNGIRVLVYVGNAGEFFVGEERWMLALDTKFTEEFTSSPALPWVTLSSGNIAGLVRSAGPGAGNYTFVNVYEAGHMVPYDQPAASLDLITRWISNEPLSL
ncbi:hypothetical protein JAAARDRAFT_119033 [Jaapia argillacea MUCL 33604]|uniref:Carboxypeptidase n=1 Tax=Jaapia argillacea MUCL 33604 TaxID=933084 RepID=A0A067QK37_9AGAM|nr:hypothetical protein JAAARDRAFT_119033 [Jaapia argillacea MUCL 33604]